MRKVEFKNLNEIKNVIENLKNNESLKLYFEDFGRGFDYFKIKNNKVYDRFNEVEFESIEEFIEESEELEFSYYNLKN